MIDKKLLELIFKNDYFLIYVYKSHSSTFTIVYPASYII